jgi:hypothetical protein
VDISQASDEIREFDKEFEKEGPQAAIDYGIDVNQMDYILSLWEEWHA